MGLDKGVWGRGVGMGFGWTGWGPWVRYVLYVGVGKGLCGSDGP